MTDFMGWDFGSDVDSLVIPEDQGHFNELPSPMNWSRWESDPLGSFEFPESHIVTNSTRKELHFNGISFSNEIESGKYRHEEDHPSDSSLCQGLCDGSLLWSQLLHRQLNHQLHDQALNEETDDISFNSFLEDLSRTDAFPGSLVPAHNHSADLFPKSCNITSNMDGMENSAHLISSSASWLSGEITTCRPPLKGQMIKIPEPSDSLNKRIDEEISLEGYVLQKLKMVTTQLPKKTRLCVRDAFYRLAENSKQHTVFQGRNGDLVLEKSHTLMVHDEKLGSESKTNAIDRALVNLMFNNMSFGAEDFSSASALNFKEEDYCTTGLSNNILNTQKTISVKDAEVPIFGQEENPPWLRANLPANFSNSPMEVL